MILIHTLIQPRKVEFHEMIDPVLPRVNNIMKEHNVEIFHIQSIKK